MKSKAKICLIVLILSLFNISSVRAPPETQTVRITATSDDGFVTEAGIGFDSSLVHVLDPNMDIRSYLIFRDIEINFWEPLTNATLRLHTSNTLTFEADSTVTIYGVRQSDFNGFSGPSEVLSAPVTSASVNFNTSQFYGGAWFDIDVKAIIEELIRNPNWDGEGTDGLGPKDNIGFVIYGADGFETRYFYDFSVGNGLEAQLVIHWNHEPSPPVAGMTFIGIHGENYSIWRYDSLGDNELLYMHKSAGIFHNSTTGLDGTVNWAPGAGFGFTSSGGLETIERLDPWVFILADNSSTTVYYSDDEFSAGSIRASEPNAQYPVLNPFAGNLGSIHLDQNDTQTLHVVWTTVTPWENAVYNVVYSNFTVLGNGSLQWADDFVNITAVGETQYAPDLYCERDGTLHVTWYGHQGTAHDQIWYMRRYPNGTWGPQVRVTEGDAVSSHEPEVIANEDTGEALIAWTYVDVANTLRWDVVYPNNTDGVDGVLANARYASMVNDRDNNVAHLTHQDTSGNMRIYYRYKPIDNFTAWSAVQSVSPGAEKHLYPSISLNEENDTLAIIWWNDWNTKTAYNVFQIGDAPVAGKTTLANIPFTYTSNPDYFGRHVDWTVFMIVDENGTNVANSTSLTGAEDWIDLNFPDPEDPNPGGTWEDTGPFTRFRTRLYIWILGVFMIFGPVFSFAYRRPSGYAFVIGLFIMLIGLGFMIAAGSV